MRVGGENGARLLWDGAGFGGRLLRVGCVFFCITATPERISKTIKKSLGTPHGAAA